MTQQSLKVLFVIDQETKAFSPAGHNLDPQAAVERSSELENEGKKVQIVDQPSKHKALSFNRCKACTTAAENLSQKKPEDPPGEQSEGG